jgi:chromosome condensin MukBEF ATPase and DNA-binding subunit MukB
VKKWFYVYDCLAVAFSRKLPPPLSLVEKEEVPKFKQEEVDELKSDLQDYHRRRGVTGQACLEAFFQRWIQPLRERASLMCDSPDAISPSGEPIEPLIELQVLVVTNKMLGPKFHLIGKYSLVEPLSSKPRGDESSVRC